MFAIIDVGGWQLPYVAGVLGDRKVPKVSQLPAIQPVGRENHQPEQQAHAGSSSFQKPSL